MERDMRCLTERFIRRHGQDIDVLDADRLAGRLQRYLPIDMRGSDTLSTLRSIVIDVAGQRFVPTRWGSFPPVRDRSVDGGADSR